MEDNKNVYFIPITPIRLSIILKFKFKKNIVRAFLYI